MSARVPSGRSVAALLSSLALLLSQLPFGSAVATAATETLTFTATDDASVRADRPTLRYGTLTTLEADGQPDKDFLIRFAVTGVAGRQVNRATLRLYGVDPSPVGGTFATTTSTSWSEAMVTWANAPAASGAVGSIGPVATGNWYELNLSSIVTGDGVVSLRATTASNNGVDYASRQGVATQRPQLVVEVSTPPASDTTPPSVPGNLRTTSVGSDHVGLAWNASTDDVGVSGYELTRNGAPLATVSGSTTGYLDATVVPATSYSYAVRAVDAAGNRSSYSPALVVVTPAASSDPVLVGAGDIATCGSSNDEATAALVSNVAGTVFTTGDNAYPDGTAADFANCYGPSWGQASIRTRTRPAAGNHDYHTPSASAYFSYFGAAAGDPAKGYYSYGLGTWHVVVLNSNCSKVGGCLAGSAQEQWLRNDLAATPHQNIAAIWHHPRHSSGPHGPTADTQALWQALHEFGAEVVISGHDHLYERFAPMDPAGNAASDGIRQFIVGTGGAGLYAAGAPAPNSQVRASVHGVLKLTLRSDSYDWQFLATPGSTFTDAGSAAVHARPPSDTQPPAPPTGLSATPAGSTRVDLAWSAPNDNVGVVGYEVERNGAVIASTGAVTAYADTTVVAGQTYSYRIRARDAAANWSAWTAAVSATTPMPASSLTFQVAEDASIRPDQPGRNYGSDPVLLVDASSEKDFLLKFVVSGIGGQPVTSARLKLWCLDASILGGQFYRVDQPWSESTVTWSNAPPAVGGALASLGPVTTSTWYEVDLTGYVTGNGTYSLRISSPSSDGADYASSEGTGGFGPVLVLSLGNP